MALFQILASSSNSTDDTAEGVAESHGHFAALRKVGGAFPPKPPAECFRASVNVVTVVIQSAMA